MERSCTGRPTREARRRWLWHRPAAPIASQHGPQRTAARKLKYPSYSRHPAWPPQGPNRDPRPGRLHERLAREKGAVPKRRDRSSHSPGPGLFPNRQAQDLETPQARASDAPLPSHRRPHIQGKAAQRGGGSATQGDGLPRSARRGPDPTAQLEFQDGGTRCSCG